MWICSTKQTNDIFSLNGSVLIKKKMIKGIFAQTQSMMIGFRLYKKKILVDELPVSSNLYPQK